MKAIGYTIFGGIVGMVIGMGSIAALAMYVALFLTMGGDPKEASRMLNEGAANVWWIGGAFGTFFGFLRGTLFAEAFDPTPEQIRMRKESAFNSSDLD